MEGGTVHRSDVIGRDQGNRTSNQIAAPEPDTGSDATPQLALNESVGMKCSSTLSYQMLLTASDIMMSKTGEDADVRPLI